MVATSFGGRNRLCAAEFARRKSVGERVHIINIFYFTRIIVLFICRVTGIALRVSYSKVKSSRVFPL